MAEKKKPVVQTVRELALPVADGMGLEVWDVEFKKEGPYWFLRVFIDSPNGIDSNSCEAFSRALGDILDEADPIEQSYMFEVSSPGIDRALKTPAHFERFVGYDVEVRLYRAREGKKSHIGELLSYDGGRVTIAAEDKEMIFEADEVSQVRLNPDFS